MKAVCWQGKHDVRVETVPEPRLLSPTDAILQVTAAAIGGTDLHLYDALLPGVLPGDILGHEFMGVVVEVGSRVSRLRAGDRVVVPAAIGCGVCWFCRQEQWGLCDNTHPSPREAETVHGFAGAGRFGMGRRFGGFAGGQAEFVRIPFADRMAVEMPAGIADEALLLLAASFPAGWMAAESCAIRPGEVMAVFGCGAVGLLAI
ncbi:MAG: alcohol dehydrogenase catalytic domain-containing protein, partial [Desulfuromonadales bacterium]|nr:alcohol dehydrogenase catalytic domain-containing protein [Desulfuromonadales bacterium]